MYRQGIPDLDLWVERGTPNVPADGRFHVVHDGKSVSNHAREADALAAYNRLRESLRPSQQAAPPIDTAEVLRRERTHYEAQSVVFESQRRRGDSGRRKGGKGR